MKNNFFLLEFHENNFDRQGENRVTKIYSKIITLLFLVEPSQRFLKQLILYIIYIQQSVFRFRSFNIFLSTYFRKLPSLWLHCMTYVYQNFPRTYYLFICLPHFKLSYFHRNLWLPLFIRHILSKINYQSHINNILIILWRAAWLSQLMTILLSIIFHFRLLPGKQ